MLCTGNFNLRTLWMNGSHTVAQYTVFVYSNSVFNLLLCSKPGSFLSEYAGSDGGANVQGTVEQATACFRIPKPLSCCG